MNLVQTGYLESANMVPTFETTLWFSLHESIILTAKLRQKQNVLCCEGEVNSQLLVITQVWYEWKSLIGSALHPGLHWESANIHCISCSPNQTCFILQIIPSRLFIVIIVFRWSLSSLQSMSWIPEDPCFQCLWPLYVYMPAVSSLTSILSILSLQLVVCIVYADKYRLNDAI